MITFGVPLDEKFKLAKSMLKADVKPRYSLVANKIVTQEKVSIYQLTNYLTHDIHIVNLM